MEAKPVRIAVLGLSSQYVHSSLAPWCLLAGLSAYAKSPYTARVVEGTVNDRLDAVLYKVLEARPDILGISCYIWNIRFVEGLLPLLREALPRCVIVLGGPEVSHRPEDTLLALPQADFVLAGEGELPFARLADALQGGGELEAVPGLCFRKEEGFHLSPPFSHPYMQPSPYIPAYFQALQGRIAYLETSRGCPYSCAFCLSGRGEKLRQATLSRAFSELVLLANSGTATVKLVDRTFNADRKRARDILAFLIREQGRAIPLGVTFHFEIAGDLLEEATLSLLETAPRGLFQFEIGLQSMDETTLRLVRRNTDMAHLKRMVSRLIASGRSHVHLDLIAGLPGEGLEAFIRGFDEAYALRPQALQLGFLKLIHGSAMRGEPEAYPCSFDPLPPYQVLSTPDLSGADFTILHTAERALDLLHNSGRFPRTLEFLFGEGGRKPFDLFLLMGNLILQAQKEKGSLPLDALTNLFAATLFELLPQQAAQLRDLLVKDRLSTVKTTVLPVSLKRKDPRFYPVKRALEKRFPRPLDTARALAFLYAGEGDRVVWCDYGEKDPVTGSYPLEELPVGDLLGP